MIAWLLIAFSAAQVPHHPADSRRPAAGQTAIEMAARPLPVRTGIGSAHDPVGTRSASAQAFYDQGLAYLHSFVWLEAARSFNQALRLDPNLGIAHAMLSIALTELNAPAAAREALQRARARAARTSEHDRRHIEARGLQMAAEEAGRQPAPLAAYRAALDEALAMFPADEEFWLLRGLAESPDPAERGQGGVAGSARFHEKALALAPGHFAAHHYLAHVLENTARIDDALGHSRIYARMAPGVPHARHMHGHALRRLGHTEEAVAEFQAADALERAYFKAEGLPVESDWHYQHNLDLLAASYQSLGQMSKAETLLKQSFRIQSASVEQEFNKRAWPAFLLLRGRATEALEAATAMAGHRSPIVSAAGHVMIGEARLAIGQFQAAADEANDALRLMRSAPLGAGLVANSLQALQGQFLLKTGQKDRGHAMVVDVVRKIRAAPGPDAWTQALFTLEAIARTAREGGDWEFADWAARQMIEHDPGYAGGHLMLALVAEHRNDNATARAAFERARRQWKNADPGLPEIQTIYQHLHGDAIIR